MGGRLPTCFKGLEGVTIEATMSQPKRKKAKPVNRHAEPRESFHLPPGLQAALEKYVEQSRPETTKSATCRVALEEFLERAGLWPPQPTV